MGIIKVGDIMKSFNKRTFSLICIISIILFMTLPITSYATDLNSIDVYVNLLENGDAEVTMVWDYYDDYGTEHFIPISASGIEILNLNVSKNNVEYETLDDWDINASREEKKDKAGIMYDGENYELCWGIGEYGKNEYTVSYIVKDIIKNAEDAQILHYRFINDSLSEPPEKISITVNSFKDFNQEDVLMWAFGFEGEIQLENGKVVAKSFKPLKQSNYAHILLRFEPGYFNVSEDSYVDMPFEEIKNIAFEGGEYVDYGPVDPNNYPVEHENESDFSPLFFLIPIITLGATGLIIGKVSSANSKKFDLDQKSYKGEYFRDVPYKGDPVDIYYILSNLNMTDHTNYITYFFLKWLKSGNIKKVTYENGVFFKKEKSGFQIISPPKDASKSEGLFFRFLTEAAGTDNMLEEKEFDKWMSKNSSKFKTFMDSLEDSSELKLLDTGYLEYEQRKALFMTFDVPKLSNTGKDVAENSIRFKNYLKDFSLLNERESANVHIWDSYMMYAAIFGITDVVEKEFKKLYPNYFEETQIDLNTIYLANLYSRSITSSYTSVTSASSSISSGGFGGGTSIGGGCGGFGGGSGGGTR